MRRCAEGTLDCAFGGELVEHMASSSLCAEAEAAADVEAEDMLRLQRTIAVSRLNVEIERSAT